MAKAKKQIWTATGRRKSSVARVRLVPGEGKLTINGREGDAYLCRAVLRMDVDQPFNLTDSASKYNIDVLVSGGGLTGQAGAIRHGISRALLKVDTESRKVLKPAGMLTRDARSKERKKYGQRAARARFQFSKR